MEQPLQTDVSDGGLDELADFGELVQLAGQELERRFKEDPDSLPGTFVIKLFLDGNKALRAGEVAETEAAPPEPDVLDLIQSPGLPDERKLQLLLAEKELTLSRLADLDEALENL